MREQKFFLEFKDNWFNTKDILYFEDNIKLEVLESPHKKW